MPFLLPNQKHQSTVETRIQIGWNNIQAFVTIAYQKDMSLIVRGRLYSSCVRSAMLHGNENGQMDVWLLFKLQDLYLYLPSKG